MAWLTFIGAILLDRDGEHIHVTIVVDLVGERAREIIGVFTDVMCLAVSTWAWCWSSAVGSVQADAHSSMVSVPIPLAVVSVSLVIGAALMFVHVAARAWHRIAHLRQARA